VPAARGTDARNVLLMPHDRPDGAALFH